MNRRVLLLLLLLVIPSYSLLSAPAAENPRNLRVDDIFALKRVGDPRISPDSRWVAYTVSSMDPKEDQSDTDIFMAPLAGGKAVRLTASKKSETRPRWSPDGKYLAFLSAREGKKTQVWLLDRRGGDAFQLTHYKASVSDLSWSPDGLRLALVVTDVDPQDANTEAAEKEKEKKPKPIVINRLQFKRDGQGYLRDLRRHIYIFNLQKKTSIQITDGPYDDGSPTWSPDGRSLAFVSNRTPEPDSNDNTDIFIVEAKEKQTPRSLTTSPGADGAPTFSPDGKSIAYVAGGDPKEIWYATNYLAQIPVAGGPSKPLTSELDRNVSGPRFAQRGRAILFTVEDGGNRYLARLSISRGSIRKVITGERVIQAFDVGRRGEVVVLESQPNRPAEVFLSEARSLIPLTQVNGEFLSGIKLATVERFKATSADGTRVDGFLTRPPGTPAGAKLPTILRIHGGPVSQFSTSFNLEWQILAAQGYAVVAANPRGSSGYGHQFSRAIWADWGNKDYDDVMAAVDYVIEMGVADPARLGVGGWSYGGILTNYVITKTDRFKAAISGASEVNYLSNYGTDHYQLEWEGELGLPWENTDLWIKLSPWFRVEKIVTPTLILCGSNDMNVPLLNSEQLYQALRRLGRETELVIYPGQTHAIRRPSFQKDRYERYIAWYDRHLKPEPANSKPQMNTNRR